MLYSVSLLIRCHIVKVVKENERIVNQFSLLKSKKCRELEANHFVKRNKRSKVVSKCSGGALLAQQRLNTISNGCVSNHLLTAPKYVLSSVHQFTTTRESRSKTLSAIELKKSMENLTDQFMEARELLEDARESMGTVYFSEDMDEARTAVVTTLEQYQSLLSQLSEDQKQEVLRTIGLRMEELKAQEQSIKDSLKDD